MKNKVDPLVIDLYHGSEDIDDFLNILDNTSSWIDVCRKKWEKKKI